MPRLWAALRDGNPILAAKAGNGTLREGVLPDKPNILILGIGNLLWADEGFGVRAVEEFNRQYETPDNIVVMDGVPILNEDLSVAAIGFEPYKDYYLGVLLTPWFMNLRLAPQNAEDFSSQSPKVGETLTVLLPAGQVEFLVWHEESYGYWLSCSLFSPMNEFADQSAVMETASAALKEALNTDVRAPKKTLTCATFGRGNCRSAKRLRKTLARPPCRMRVSAGANFLWAVGQRHRKLPNCPPRINHDYRG